MEQNFGKGAVVTPTIGRMPTVAMSSFPFDWATGYSTRELITKNQFTASSCGGEAVSYKGEADTGIPKSAKFPYSQAFVVGGGSGEADLIKIAVTEGLCDESILPSYKSDGTTDEAFMEDTSGITPLVLLNARTDQSIPEYVDLSFEGIAQAVRDHNGCIIGIYGQNNGTWTSQFPQAPAHIWGSWCHWLFVGKALIINGKKFIGVKNSWGNVGDNGWQYLGEEYLPYIWSAWTFVKSSGYKFYQNMFLGCNNQDVFALQARLGITPTGFFGLKTFAYTVAYQKANGITATGFAGPLTRSKLNSS